MILENQINTKLKLFYSPKLTIGFILSFHYGQLFIAYYYQNQGLDRFFDYSLKNVGFWLTGPILMYMTYLIIKVFSEFESLYSDDDSQNIRRMFKSDTSFNNFVFQTKMQFRYRYQGLYILFVTIVSSTWLFLIYVNHQIYWSGINLHDYTELHWFEIYICAILFVNVTIPGFALYPFLISMMRIHAIGNSKELSILSFDNIVTQKNQPYISTLTEFSNQSRKIGNFLFNITMRIVLIGLIAQISAILIGTNITGIVLSSSFILFIILLSFIPQYQIHKVLQIFKMDYLRELQLIKDQIRIDLYRKLKEGVGQEITGTLNILDNEIKEISEMSTWTYDFPEVLKLFAGALLSFILLIVNLILSIELQKFI